MIETEHMKTDYQDVDFIWPNIVIGADLEAVRYAHDNKYHLIKNRQPYFHSYEGKEEEWAAKSYRLYCIGLSPFTDKVSSLRILQDDKIIKAHTRNNVFKIRYENLHLYDDENVEGVSLERKLLHYRVIDWFDCQGLYDLNFEKLTTEDKFVNKVLLFKSRRIDGNQKYLDLLCESFLTTEQLKNFDYGDTMVRFKVSKLLKDSGLNRFKLHFWKRDAYPIYETIY